MSSISLIRPDDWHLHLRDAPQLGHVVGHTAAQFARAIIMPNLTPPVTTCDLASAYRERILTALPANSNFEPLMTLYLTDNTEPAEIEAASNSDFIHAAKLYPAGATTNSDAGVTAIDNIYPVLEAMQRCDFPLLVHGESTAPGVDVFDREKEFIDETMIRIRRDFPELRIVFEHITTSEAVEFVLAQDDKTAATITPHHLLINRNAIFTGGIRPHHYCLPIAKRETHRQALLAAATSESPKFFAGTDSAPHAQGAKESACGCAGIYSAHCAVELYAEAFDNVGNFDNFEHFMSRNGPTFYQLPINEGTVTLEQQEWLVPANYPFGDEQLIPFRAGETLRWKLIDG